MLNVCRVNFVVVEKSEMSNRQSELLEKLGADFGNLQKEINVSRRGEAVKNSTGVEMRTR